MNRSLLFIRNSRSIISSNYKPRLIFTTTSVSTVSLRYHSHHCTTSSSSPGVKSSIRAKLVSTVPLPGNSHHHYPQEQLRMASTQTHGREILPTNVIPRHYRLSLTPDFSTFKYKGIVTVDLDVTEPTSSIVLNALDLELHSATVSAGGKKLTSKGIDTDEEKQIATLQFEGELTPGTKGAVLNVEFTGILNDKMAGFYRSSYIDVKTGEKKWLATTQMGISISSCIGMIANIQIEPTDARRAFPCWDEPGVKATFEVEITADKALTVLSNMDVNKETEAGDGKKVTLFNPTPKMSTYVQDPLHGQSLTLVIGFYRWRSRKD